MRYVYLGLAAYLLVISLIAVIVTLADKRRAIKQKWRVSEKALITIAFLGGAIAMLITMRKCRHKTKHAKFMVGIPFIIALHILLIAATVYLVYFKTGSLDVFLNW